MPRPLTLSSAQTTEVRLKDAQDRVSSYEERVGSQHRTIAELTARVSRDVMCSDGISALGVWLKFGGSLYQLYCSHTCT